MQNLIFGYAVFIKQKARWHYVQITLYPSFITKASTLILDKGHVVEHLQKECLYYFVVFVKRHTFFVRMEEILKWKPKKDKYVSPFTETSTCSRIGLSWLMLADNRKPDTSDMRISTPAELSFITESVAILSARILWSSIFSFHFKLNCPSLKIGLYTYRHMFSVTSGDMCRSKVTTPPTPQVEPVVWRMVKQLNSPGLYFPGVDSRYFAVEKTHPRIRQGNRKFVGHCYNDSLCSLKTKHWCS